MNHLVESYFDENEELQAVTGATVKLVDRVSDDYNWTFRLIIRNS